MKVSLSVKSRLDKLQREFEEKAGKHISMSELVSGILDSYLDTLPDATIEDKKIL